MCLPAMVFCCKWLFAKKGYADMEGKGGKGITVITDAPQRPKIVAKTIGRKAGGDDEAPYFVAKDVSEEERQKRRQEAAERAEKREHENLSRGVGNVEKAKQMQQANQKEELIGKIAEQYEVFKEEVPMGIKMADLPLLKKHLTDLQARPRPGEAKKKMRPEDLISRPGQTGGKKGGC